MAILSLIVYWRIASRAGPAAGFITRYVAEEDEKQSFLAFRLTASGSLLAMSDQGSSSYAIFKELQQDH